MMLRFAAHLAVLAVAGCWLLWRSGEVARSEQRVARLEALVSGGIGAGEPQKVMDRQDGESGEQVAAAVSLMRRIAGGFREKRQVDDDLTRLSLLIADLSAEEIEKALDELKGVDVGESDYLLTLLARRLEEISPERALEHFRGRFHEKEGGLFSILIGAMEKWSERDPEAAEAWLDGEIAAGHFEPTRLDGMSSARLRAERPLIGSLLRTIPAAARRRIEAMPPEHRGSAFMGISPAGADPAAYGDLLRATLGSANEIENAFMSGTHHLVEAGAGYAEISSFLDQSGSTLETRGLVAFQTAEKIEQRNRSAGPLDAGGIESIRAWVSRVAPGEEEKVMAKLGFKPSLPDRPKGTSGVRRNPLPEEPGK